MILYTPLSPVEVLEGMDSYRPEYIEVEQNGATLIIEMTSPHEGRLVRLISPRSDDYLLQEYQPGETITFKPVHH